MVDGELDVVLATPPVSQRSIVGTGTMAVMVVVGMGVTVIVGLGLYGWLVGRQSLRRR